MRRGARSSSEATLPARSGRSTRSRGGQHADWEGLLSDEYGVERPEGAWSLSAFASHIHEATEVWIRLIPARRRIVCKSLGHRRSALPDTSSQTATSFVDDRQPSKLPASVRHAHLLGRVSDRQRVHGRLLPRVSTWSGTTQASDGGSGITNRRRGFVKTTLSRCRRTDRCLRNPAAEARALPSQAGSNAVVPAIPGLVSAAEPSCRYRHRAGPPSVPGGVQTLP